MFGEISAFSQNRIRRVLRRRLNNGPYSDEVSKVLNDPGMFDELCCRLGDEFQSLNSGPTGSRITDFVDWLIGLDWDKIASIIKIIITIFG